MLKFLELILFFLELSLKFLELLEEYPSKVLQETVSEHRNCPI